MPAKRCRSGCIGSTTCTAATVRSQRYPFMKPLKHPVSHYLRNNVYITNSGVAWQPAIEFCQKVHRR